MLKPTIKFKARKHDLTPRHLRLTMPLGVHQSLDPPTTTSD